MRLLLIFLILLSTIAQAQDKPEVYFTIETEKRSESNIYPFYDEEEDSIKVFLLFQEKFDPSTIKMQWAVQKRSKNAADLYRKSCTPLPYPSGTLHIPINDTFVKSGNYQIAVRLFDLESKKLRQEAKLNIQTFRTANDFYTDNKISVSLNEDNNLYSDLDLSKTFVEEYDLENIKRNIEGLFAIATSSERKLIQGLTESEELNVLKRFFFNFWLERNISNPESAWREYAEQLNTVAQLFGSGTTAGHQTDRGRIYLAYGKPSFRVSANNERGVLPYEIWFYPKFKEFSNVNLLFCQTGMMRNRMRLLHSSRQEFMFNPQWKQELFTDQAEIDNKLAHKVFDYFNQ